MRGRWIGVGIVIAIVAGIIALTPNGPRSSPEHRSDSDAPDGSSALVQYAAKLGHPTLRLSSAFDLPGAGTTGLLFVFTPTQPFTAAETRRLLDWVSAGGILVYADLAGDPRLDTALSVTRAGYQGAGADAASGASVPMTATPSLTAGASDVSGGGEVRLLEVGPDQQPLLSLRDSSSDTTALTFARDTGRAVVLGDPQVLCNSTIGLADNGRFAADIISLAPTGSTVMFDEFHHGVGQPTASLFDWVGSPAGAAIFWLVIVLYLGLLLRSRAFGPALPISFSRGRSSAEYASAVGTLLRRSGAREATYRLLSEAAHRAVAERVGLGHGVAPAQLAKVLEHRAPHIAAELHQAGGLAGSAAASERGLEEAARRLHALAYPSAGSR